VTGPALGACCDSKAAPREARPNGCARSPVNGARPLPIRLDPVAARWDGGRAGFDHCATTLRFIHAQAAGARWQRVNAGSSSDHSCTSGLRVGATARHAEEKGERGRRGGAGGGKCRAPCAGSPGKGAEQGPDSHAVSVSLSSPRGGPHACQLNPPPPKPSPSQKRRQQQQQRINLRTGKLHQRGKKDQKENRLRGLIKKKQTITCLQKMEKLAVQRLQDLMQQERKKQSLSNISTKSFISGPSTYLPCTIQRNIFINYFVNASFLVVLQNTLLKRRESCHFRHFPFFFT
uniref:Uncharacterized protein n=1 Tax=Chrysemys picta bellii TaxID=8478 RepID=A0A8C3HEK4_CHRPI